MKDYIAHYHTERNHQGKNNLLLLAMDLTRQQMQTGQANVLLLPGRSRQRAPNPMLLSEHLRLPSARAVSRRRIAAPGAAIRFGSRGGVTIAEYGAFVVLSSQGLR